MAVTVGDAILPVVDGCSLPAAHRALLRPGGFLPGRDGEAHRLPRYFYFVAKGDGSGTHNFSSDYSAHERNVMAYRHALAQAKQSR